MASLTSVPIFTNHTFLEFTFQHKTVRQEHSPTAKLTHHHTPSPNQTPTEVCIALFLLSSNGAYTHQDKPFKPLNGKKGIHASVQ